MSQNVRGLPQLAIDSGVVQDIYGYDPDANVTAITDGLPGGVASRGMAYDGLDRLITANSPGVWGTASYGYDPIDNLRSSTVGGRSTTHVYDGANRLAQLVSNGVATAYGYDAQGNVIAKGNRGFLFDAGNRLLASGSASYAYDGLGRRTVQNGTDGRQRVQMYSQDGQLLYGIYKPPGGVASAIRYVYLGGKLIAEADPTAKGGVRFLHTDGLGRPVARTDNTGALIDRTRYEPYGATAAGTNPGATADNIGFTGHANDSDTGLVYMQQRYYDPIAGRFLSVDPVMPDTSTGNAFNRFAYARNNPYRYVDPTGEEDKEDAPDKRQDQINKILERESKNNCSVSSCGGFSGSSGASSGGAKAGSQSRTWGSYLPGTEAGENAAQYWADMQVQTGNPLYAVPGVFASLWTSDTAANTAFTLATAGGGGTLMEAAGPLKQWIRLGPSYSKAGGINVDMSIRWGASPAGGGRYIQQIPSPTLQGFNQWLRSLQVPVGGWRAADPGHFHLW